MSKTKYIGLFGFGTVGQGFYEILKSNKKETYEIKGICIKDIYKARAIEQSYFTDKADTLLNDEQIDIIVEVIDDSEAAFQLVSKALTLGKDVISANKKMIAEHYQELLELEKQSSGTLLFEAAVAGSIPIIQSINDYLKNLSVNKLVGILNGSSNYVLTQIADQSWSYEKAIEEAQEKGFAESNPTLDVGGFDARYKLSILNSFAFNQFVAPSKVPIFGIETISQSDFAYANQQAATIKSIAYSERTSSGGLISWVAPALLPAKHSLGYVENELNGVVVETEFGGEQLLSGKGAGKLPTASAVFNDLLLLAIKYEYVNRTIQAEPLLDKAWVQLRIRSPFQLDRWPSFLKVLKEESQEGQSYYWTVVEYQYLQEVFDLCADLGLFPLVDLTQVRAIQNEVEQALFEEV